MKIVLTYGTFDLFHVGHVRLLKRLRDLGDQLIVGVSTDAFNTKKGKRATMSYADRAEIVGALRYVDLVIPEHDWAQKITDIQNYNVALFGMGDDWAGKFDELKNFCDVVYLPRTEGISTTSLKSTIYERNVAA